MCRWQRGGAPGALCPACLEGCVLHQGCCCPGSPCGFAASPGFQQPCRAGAAGRATLGSRPGCAAPLNLLLPHKPGWIWSPLQTFVLKNHSFLRRFFNPEYSSQCLWICWLQLAQTFCSTFIMGRGRTLICRTRSAFAPVQWERAAFPGIRPIIRVSCCL